jgi:hypothetical protein
MKQAKLFFVLTLLLTSVICVSAQGNQYPNELKDYEFFGKGKLKKIKLGASTQKEVKKIFGKGCKKECDYDENFKIKFEYLAAFDDCMSTEDIRDRLMCPQNDFVGTISSITVEPKQSKVLKDLPTSKLNKFSGGSTTAKGSGTSVSYTSFADKYGLKYSIFSGNTFYSQYPPFVEGKLYSIKYILTDNFIRKVFTVEYMTRKKEMSR